MTKYNCFYDGGTFNCVNDNVYADSVDEARDIFISNWRLGQDVYVKVRAV